VPISGIVSFTNGVAMSAPDLRTNFTAIQTWLNGGVVIGDFTGLGLRARNFRKMDHVGYSGATSSLSASVKSSMGPSGGYFNYAIDGSPGNRVYLTGDSHDMGAWRDVATMNMHLYLPDAGYVEVEPYWWCWAPQSDRTDVAGGPEALSQCAFRTRIAGNDYDSTRRTLYDSAHDSDAVTQGGQFLYPARNFSTQAQQSVSAGWINIRLQVNFSSITLANRAKQALVIVGARGMTVTYDRL